MGHLLNFVKLCIRVNYQIPFILTATFHVACKRCLSHGMCLNQVMMTLHFLNDVANEAESTQKWKITSQSLV